MPVRSSQLNPARITMAFVIVGVHAVVIVALMSLRSNRPVSAELSPVVVRLVAESAEKPQWQPPKVTPVVPLVNAPMPDVPVIETPIVAPPSEHAINLPSAIAASREAAQQAGDIVRQVASVEYAREPAPRYPPQSKKFREQGLVVLRVLIDERGAPCEVQIATSSGHERLDRAAREAIALAEFRPYLEDGVARRALVLIPIEFSLDRHPTRIAANGA
jgi:protein TonB